MSKTVTVLITRHKLYPVPGRVGRFAWKWLYDAAFDGEPYLIGFDRLDSIRSRARELAKQLDVPVKIQIVESWKEVARVQ